MNKFMIPRAALALRFTLNNLHLSSLTSCPPKTCSLLLIIVFGLTQLPMHSAASAPRKARLVFDTSWKEYENPNTGFTETTGIGTTSGKSKRKFPEGEALYQWKFPETIEPAGATFQIGVAVKANEGRTATAIISFIGIVVKESEKSHEVTVGASHGEGTKKAVGTFTIVPQPAYESPQTGFRIVCHDGFHVVFRYTVEQ